MHAHSGQINVHYVCLTVIVYHAQFVTLTEEFLPSIYIYMYLCKHLVHVGKGIIVCIHPAALLVYVFMLCKPFVCELYTLNDHD